MQQAKPCLDHASFKSHWAPNPSTERGDSFHLGAHPKESKIIYPSGKFIVVRDVVKSADCFVYRGHNAKTTVAKFSPNGFWVASADITGKVSRGQTCLLIMLDAAFVPEFVGWGMLRTKKKVVWRPSWCPQ